MTWDPMRSWRWRALPSVVLLLCLALASGSAWARRGPQPVLNPTVYESPNKAFSLLVDPSDPYGRGGASYRLSKNGKEAWAGEKPFALFRAVVADDGLVAGYAYSNGEWGFGEGGYRAGPGDFTIVLLSPTGAVLAQQTQPRTWSDFHDYDPNPLAAGIILQPELGRFLVRIEDPNINRAAEQWWTFSLATGEKLGVVEATQENPQGQGWDGCALPVLVVTEERRMIQAVQTVPGTPLLLVHWWHYSASKAGGFFTLAGPEGKTLWRLDRPADYEIPGDDTAEYRLRERLWNGAAIGATGREGEFELLFATDHAFVTFKVAHDADGKWVVTELGRRPDTWQPKAEAPGPEFPEGTLDFLGTFVLKPKDRAPEPEPLLRRILSFTFAGDGRIALLRWAFGKSEEFVWMEPTGRVLREFPLDAIVEKHGRSLSNLAWIGKECFLLAASEDKDDGKATFWRIDAGTGEIRPIPGIDCSCVSTLATRPGGGFAALVVGHPPYGSPDEVHIFDAAGKRLLKVDDRSLPDRTEGFWTFDRLAFGLDGELRVLRFPGFTNVGHGLVLAFRADGSRGPTWKLDEVWHPPSREPENICRAPNGNFIVYDECREASFVEMTPAGKVVREFGARDPDGRGVAVGEVQCAPDGRVWVSHGQTLTQLGPDGVADRVLGTPLDLERLHGDASLHLEPDLYVDAEDRCYLVDALTGAIHVFDETGKLLHICKPDPRDPAQYSDWVESRAQGLAASSAGDCYVALDARCRKGWLRFSPTGARMDIVPAVLPRVGSEQWFFQPGSARRWVAKRSGTDLLLVDGAGTVSKTIRRRPDGTWIESLRAVAVAPDGSSAIVAAADYDRPHGAEVCIYSADGLPMRAFSVPRSGVWSLTRLAYSGRHLVYCEGTTIHVMDATGKPVLQCSPTQPGLGEEVRGPFLAANGREIWLFNPKTLTCFRYRLP